MEMTHPVPDSWRQVTFQVHLLPDRRLFSHSTIWLVGVGGVGDCRRPDRGGLCLSRPLVPIISGSFSGVTATRVEKDKQKNGKNGEKSFHGTSLA